MTEEQSIGLLVRGPLRPSSPNASEADAGYFGGAVNLIGDAQICAAMLGGSAVITAISLWASGLPKIVRVIVPVVVIFGVQAHGDMGLNSWTSMFCLGMSLAVAAKLAVASGAFPARPTMTLAAPQPAHNTIRQHSARRHSREGRTRMKKA